MSCDAFLKSQITVIESQIIAYQTAITALGDENIQSYKLDTGQTIQTVTRADILDMQKVIDSLFNRLATLTARCEGAASIGVPGW